MTTAWLIERVGVHLCYARDGASCRWVTFTDSDARRFPTRAEAEALVTERALSDVFVCEHGWVSSKQPEDDPRLSPYWMG